MDEDYFKHNALSQSTLKKYLVSRRKAKEETIISREARIGGYIIEDALFGGFDRLHKKYAVDKYKTYCKSMSETNEDGRINVTQDHWDMAAAAINASESEQRFQRLLRNTELCGEEQVELYYQRDGIECKAKLDYLLTNEKTNNYLIIDIKSWSPQGDISVEALSYHCKKFKYDFQAAWYIDALKRAKNLGDESSVSFVNLFIDKSESPEFIWAAISDINLQHAERDIEKAIEVYKDEESKTFMDNHCDDVFIELNWWVNEYE